MPLMKTSMSTARMRKTWISRTINPTSPMARFSSGKMSSAISRWTLASSLFHSSRTCRTPSSPLISSATPSLETFSLSPAIISVDSCSQARIRASSSTSNRRARKNLQDQCSPKSYKRVICKAQKLYSTNLSSKTRMHCSSKKHFK